MNILFPTWKSFGVEDIKETFEELGHKVSLYEREPKNYRIDPRYKSEIKKYIKENDIDAVFTSNYYPVISDGCNDIKIPYLSWCYDSPLILTYSKSVFNEVNRIFIFDSLMVQELRNLGVKNVWYMPMAVNEKRLADLSISPQDRKIVESDVSFVGRLYTEEHNLYDRMEPKLDDYTKGYLEGIMESQRMIYGYTFIEELLTPDIVEKMMAAMPVKVQENGMESIEYIYANYFLCRKMTQLDRTEIFSYLGEKLHEIKLENGRNIAPMKLYTSDPTPQLKGIKNMGEVHYMYEMPLVFKYSKINLNITLRSIRNGIPLRAMDIMGAGGFLLTNYQNDFAMHFVDGEDYVSYSDREDMLNKIKYYLEHEDERKLIAENGCRKVREEHTYTQRLSEIIGSI